MDKRRVSGEETEVLDMIGKVENQTCVLSDDRVAASGGAGATANVSLK